MKKLLLIALSAMLAVPAFADSDDDNVVASSSSGAVQLKVVDHIGYGYHIVKSDAYSPSGSGELFVNLLKLGLYPAKSFGIELGVDADFNFFRSKTSVFHLDNDNKVQAMDFNKLVTGTTDKSRGGFNTTSITFPLLLKGMFGDFKIGVGAQGSLNLDVDAFYRYKQDNRFWRVEERNGKLNLFSYGFLATVSFSDATFFFKYFPKSTSMLAPGSVDYNYMTVGISFGL